MCLYNWKEPKENEIKMLLRFRGFFSILILILLVTVGFRPGLANPLPVDNHFEGNPIPSTQEQSVFFKEEFVNITFSSSKVYVSAFYTFMNNASTPSELGIQLPFASEESYTGKPPEDEVLILNNLSFTYEWKNVSLEGIGDYGDWTPFRAIEFQLSFSGYEEKKIWIYYSRDYSIYKEPGTIGEKTYYYYTYLVGTARSWNHPIKSAKFQFNFPKNICPSTPSYHGGDFDFTFEENAAWIISTLEYSDWTPYMDMISVTWTDSRSLVIPRLDFIIIPVAIIILSCLLIGVIILRNFYSKRRKEFL